MKATYLGDGADAACTVFGKDFPAGEAVDVSDLHPDHQAKLVANGMFKTSGKPAEPER